MQYKGLAFKSALDSQLPLLLIFAEREAKIAFRKQKGLFEREAEPLQKQKGFNGVQQIQMKSLYKADNKQKVLLNQVRISLKTILYASLSLRCLALMTLALQEGSSDIRTEKAKKTFIPMGTLQALQQQLPSHIFNAQWVFG